jgi:hypothetical protein
MATFVESGTMLLLIFLAINSGLMVSGAMINQSVQGSAGLFSFLPNELKAPPSVSDTNLNPTNASIGQQYATQVNSNASFLTTLSNLLSTTVGLVQQLPVYLIGILNLVIMLLFAWIFFFNQIGMPAIITWGTAVIFVPIELITLTYWVMEAIGSIFGRSPSG